MKALFEDDVAILPLLTVAAESISDFAGVSLVVKYFKKEVVSVRVA